MTPLYDPAEVKKLRGLLEALRQENTGLKAKIARTDEALRSLRKSLGPSLVWDELAIIDAALSVDDSSGSINISRKGESKCE